MTAQILWFVVCVAAFLGIFAALHRRAARSGSPTPVRWGWLGAIVAIAIVVAIVSAL